jgi:hypothetical protein
LIENTGVKINISPKFIKALKRGEIASLYNDIYHTALKLATYDLNQFQTKKKIALITASGNKHTQILQELEDYKSSRLDFHIQEMIHLFELYAESKKKK